MNVENERVRTVVVEHVPALAEVAALEFLAWVQAHPEGLVAPPLGKSAGPFITATRRLLDSWHTRETADWAARHGIDAAVTPDFSGLRWVQMAEFFPLPSTRRASFAAFFHTHYQRAFGLDSSRVVRIECETITDVDAWCADFESRIRAWGGIGFFLASLGPDGQIALNARGANPAAGTRLCPLDYATQAAIAGEVGGMEVARTVSGISIGLGTLTFRRDVTALVMAAGEAHAAIVAEAIESAPTPEVPATALHGLPNARFIITRGAAKLLRDRQFHALAHAPAITDADVDAAFTARAVALGKPLLALTEPDIAGDRIAKWITDSRSASIADLTRAVRARLIAKIDAGTQPPLALKFLHTEPHHDDIMLGYFPVLVREFAGETSTHVFVAMTSGFTAVTNGFVREHLANACEFVRAHADANGVEIGERDGDVRLFLDGIAAGNAQKQRLGEARRLQRILGEIFDARRQGELLARIDAIDNALCEAVPGEPVDADLQRLKGMIREWEAEVLWGHFGVRAADVHHLRLGFYGGASGGNEPNFARDAQPIFDLLCRENPDVVTVAFDPEGSGPDTHFIAMQATAMALAEFARVSRRDDVRVWGYRNVWFRFSPSEANVMCPVSLPMMWAMERGFLDSYRSQVPAAFPHPAHDGPFSEVARQVQISQFEILRTCLGDEFFATHERAEIRAARAFVFLREMTVAEFCASCRALATVTEAASDSASQAVSGLSD